VAAIGRIGTDYTMTDWNPAVSGEFLRCRRLLIDCIFDARNSGRQSDASCCSNKFFILQNNEKNYHTIYYLARRA
jgi:hypothetical protein